MTINYTTLLGLAQPVTGTETGQWGDVVNDEITSLLEDAVANAATFSVTSGNVTLTTTNGTSNQARMSTLIITGTPGTTRNVIAPSQAKIYVVLNQSDSSVVIKGAATTGVTLAAGAKTTVVWNGSDFVEASTVSGQTILGNLTVNGNTTLGDASTDTVTVNGTTTFNASAVVSVTDNTNAALRITQLGTGNALLVEDSANPDSTPFVIDANGRVFTGYTSSFYGGGGTTTPQIQVLGVATGDSSIAATYFGTSSTSGGILNLNRSNGAIGTQSIVSSGDMVGRADFRASDGTGLIGAARIEAYVDGTPGTNDMPGRLVFSTTADGSASPTERMRIDSSGNVGIGTSSPGGYRVAVVGSAASSIPLYLNTDATNAYVYTPNPLYLGSTGAYSISFVTNSIARMSVDSSGNVNIGTGNLTFSGSAQRITGDFSNATIASRVMFQTSTANGNTGIFVLPNGTSTSANIQVSNNSDPTNASVGILGAAGSTDVRIQSAIQGTGTYLPMTFYTGGSERMRIDTSGNVGIGSAGVASPTSVTQYTAGNNAIRYAWYQAGVAEMWIGQKANVGALCFGSGAGTTGELMRIDTSGNVGIGTSSPVSKLDALNVTAGKSAFSARGISGNLYIDYNGAGNNYYEANYHLFTNNNGSTEWMRIDTSGNVLVTNAGGGLGYGTGSGGTVTQATSKSTTVTLNKPTGQITMNNATLAAGARVTFVCNNSLVSSTDTVILNLGAGSSNPDDYLIRARMFSGGFATSVINQGAADLAEAIVINFAIIKGATS